MIAVDANILVYSYREDGRCFEQAENLVADLAAGDDDWAIPWPCISEFFSTVTNRRIWDTAATVEEAISKVEVWLNSPTLRLLSEGPGFATVWSDVLRTSGVTGGRVHDARIAALCIHHGVSELWTADRDFTRFPRLKTRNPLLA